jgi:hypothetical protein
LLLRYFQCKCVFADKNSTLFEKTSSADLTCFAIPSLAQKKRKRVGSGGKKKRAVLRAPFIICFNLSKIYKMLLPLQIFPDTEGERGAAA